MNHNDEVDQILDGALAEYRDAEPLVGMENRVLQQVRTHAGNRKRLRWQWNALAACAAMLAIATWIGLRDRADHVIVPSQLIVTRQVEPPTRNVAAMVDDKNPRPDVARVLPSRSHDVADRVRLPRTQGARMHQQFPSPAPLNSEERALLAMAQTHPEVLTELASKQDNEIAIAPIDIEPLVKATTSNQGEN